MPSVPRSAATVNMPRQRDVLTALAAARLFMAIDARRPASWLALLAGAAAGWSCGGIGAGTGDGAAIAGAVLSAAAAAVAAIGDLPLDLVAAPVLSSRRGWRWAAAWAVERAFWPLAGFVAGLLPFAARDNAGLVLASGVFGGLAAAVTVARVRLAAAGAADAASLTLAIAVASAAASVATRGGPLVAAAAAAAAWGVCGGLAGAWSRAVWALGGPPADAFAGPGTVPVAEPARGPLARDPFPAAGPLRHVLERLAMAAALVAMAGWLVLEPEHAGSRLPAAAAWACLSAAWLAALVVPQATLQDGAAGADAWQRLFRAAAARGPRRGGDELPWSFGRCVGDVRPGPVRFAAGAALAQAAILGWPPLVCALVTLPSPARAVPPALIVALLVVAAVTIAVVVAVAVAAGLSRETMFACLMGMVLGGVLATLLHLPSWFAAARRDEAVGEPPAASRETAPATQAPWLAMARSCRGPLAAGGNVFRTCS